MNHEMESNQHPGEISPMRPGLSSLGPGAALRAAREQARLSVAEIAHRTRLEPRIISALETEDYQSLAASAFIKGYLRSIARALDMDPAPLLARYTQLEETQDPKLADFATRSPAQVTSSSLVIRLVTVVLVLVFILLVAAWWRHNYQAAEKSAEELAALEQEVTAPEPDPGIPLPYAYTIVDHSQEPLGPVKTFRHQTDGSAPPAEALPSDEPAAATPLGIPADTRAVATEVAEPPQPAPTPREAPPAAAETTPEPAPQAEARPARETARPAATPAPAAPARQEPPRAADIPVPEPTPPAPRAVAGNGSQELVIEGRGESWVEVSDAAGKRLFMGTLKPGQRVALKGRPPYDMVVSFPPAISVRFNGAAVDLSDRPRSGVARYRLGRSD
ncbi:MAG: helix-turn-helix domain-containing protein [Gammaproteobacteria bacterium]|nr:helix-turn-helix domain-containing protein [Gammaproteobacteria bacterium]